MDAADSERSGPENNGGTPEFGGRIPVSPKERYGVFGTSDRSEQFNTGVVTERPKVCAWKAYVL
ncbi:MAG: hypothetical protein RQ801_04445 [Spirochaetaceae bacterium]|nr:hypothetical protein [Spirochaetaceae bacterium]